MDIEQIHKELVEIPSNEGVGQVRDYVSSLIDESRIDSHGNIIASKGSGSPHIVFNSHLDTVSPHFDYEKEENIVRGRGSCDAKGSLAVLLKVFSEMTEESISGKITIAITPDEETTTRGAKHLAEEEFTPTPELIIVGEPTNLNVCLSARGYYPGKIVLRGQGGHSSGNTPNPLFELPEVISFLKDADKIDSYRFNPTIVEGGDTINKIPEEVEISFTKRVIPSGNEDDNLDFDTIESELSKKINDFEIKVSKVDSEPFLKAFNISNENHIIRRIVEDERSRGISPFDASTEASHFVEKGLDVCIFGPGKLEDEEGPIAHSSREYIDINEMKRAENVLRNVVSEEFTSG